MAKLTATTIVRQGYEAVVLYAGDELPDWATDQVGEHLLTADPEGDAPEDAPEHKAPGRRTAAK